jgi:DNA repair protein RecO (recombination protein O)
MELLGKCIKEHESNQDLYAFLRSELEYLDNLHSGVQYFHLKFILELSTYLGFRPLNNAGPTTPFFNLQEGLFEDRSSISYHIDEIRSGYISQLLAVNKDDLPQLKIPKSMRISLIEDLLKFYQYHIEGFTGLKSFEIYRQLF